MPSCEMCGKEGPVSLASIEGSELQLCRSCAPAGSRPKTLPGRSFKPRARPEDNRRVHPNYAKILQKARTAKMMNQEEFAQFLNERTSTVHHWEAGTMKPNLKAAQHLEKKLGITLIKKTETIVSSDDENPLDKVMASGKKDTMTMGDFIKVRKRK